MDRSADIRLSGAFQCKKWTLFTFSAIGIVVTIIMAVMASQLISSYIETSFPEDKNDWKTLKVIYI